MTWWQQLIVYAAAPLISAAVLALSAWLAHQKGWLSGPLAGLGAWLQANSATIDAELVALLKQFLTNPPRATEPPPAPVLGTIEVVTVAPHPTPGPPPDQPSPSKTGT